MCVYGKAALWVAQISFLGFPSMPAATASAMSVAGAVPLAATALVVRVVVLASTAFLAVIVATAATAIAPSVAATAAAFMFEHLGGYFGHGFELAGAELGQRLGGRLGFAAEDLDAVLLQIEQQVRVHFAAEHAADLGDGRLRDRAWLGAVERFEQLAFAVEDQQVAGGAEVGSQFGFQAFRAGDGDAEFHVAVSLRSGGFWAGAG